MALEALKRSLGLDTGDNRRANVPSTANGPASGEFAGSDANLKASRDAAVANMDNSPRRQHLRDNNALPADRFGDAIGLNLSPEAEQFLNAGGPEVAKMATRSMTPLQLASNDSSQMQDFVDHFFSGAKSETVHNYAAQVNDMIMQMKGAVQDLRLDQAANHSMEQSGGTVATLVAPSGERLRVTSQYIDQDNMSLSLTYMSFDVGVLSLDMHRHERNVADNTGQERPAPHMTIRESLREARGGDLAPAMTNSLTVAF